MSTNPTGTALITDASSAIGAVYADRFAKRGYDLILVARNAERLKVLSTRIAEDTGRSVAVIIADLDNKADLARVEQVLRTDASVGVLVNNTGVATIGDLVSVDPDRLESMVRLNVLAPLRLALAAVPGFVARGHGTVINISSSGAFAPERLNGSCSGTEAFLLDLSLRLQHEVAGRGVRVQVVLPDETRTASRGTGSTDSALVPSDIVMNVDDMVDAALVGLDRGESVTLVAVAVSMPASVAVGQSAQQVRGAASVEPLVNEPPAKIIVDPPLAEPLSHGRVVIQYRTEHLHIVPVYGPAALPVSPRIGHIHVTVDDGPWRWVDASGEPLILNGFPAGPHKILIQLVNANHQPFDQAQAVVQFTVPPAVTHTGR